MYGHPLSRRGFNGNARRLLRGFTIIELLVTVAVAAILLTVVVPSFVSVTQSTRASAEANLLVGDLYLARSEAIKRGQSVTVCSSSDGLSCNGNPAVWSNGWIVFPDPAGTQVVAAGAPILRQQPPWTSTDSFTSAVTSMGQASAQAKAITYNRDGIVAAIAGQTIWTLHTSPVNASATRCVEMNQLGRVQTLTANGSNCV